MGKGQLRHADYLRKALHAALRVLVASCAQTFFYFITPFLHVSVSYPISYNNALQNYFRRSTSDLYFQSVLANYKPNELNSMIL